MTKVPADRSLLLVFAIALGGFLFGILLACVIKGGRAAPDAKE